MKEEEKIIQKAPLEMQEMLGSVLAYNSSYKGKLLRKILFAMTVIDRKFFVQDEDYAYDDNALPIGKGQTISQPSTVARMLLLSELQEGDDILEIGTGSGWNASLIAFLIYPGEVKSVDRMGDLVDKAKLNLGKLRNYLKQKHPQDVAKLEGVSFSAEDVFSENKVWKRKYDKIIFTAGIESGGTEEKVEGISGNLLKKNGILICPYVSGPLVIYRKKSKDKVEREETREHYVFVPLLEGVER